MRRTLYIQNEIVLPLVFSRSPLHLANRTASLASTISRLSVSVQPYTFRNSRNKVKAQTSRSTIHATTIRTDARGEISGPNLILSSEGT